MVRPDLRLTRVHDPWARRRLLAAVAAARVPRPAPGALDALRALACALGEDGIAAWAAAGGAEPMMARGEAAVVDAVKSAIPAEATAPVHEMESPLAPVTAPMGEAKPSRVCLRPASSTRVPRARLAWIASILRAASLEIIEDEGTIATGLVRSSAAGEWLDRLADHPEIEVSR